jgi:hypothetical protein
MSLLDDDDEELQESDKEQEGLPDELDDFEEEE